MKKLLSCIVVLQALIVYAPFLALSTPIKTSTAVKGTAIAGAATVCAILGYKGYKFLQHYQSLNLEGKIDCIIKNKRFFSIYLKTQNWYSLLFSKNNISDKIKQWLVKRLISHLENEKITSFDDLPWLDRKIIRLIDKGYEIKEDYLSARAA